MHTFAEGCGYSQGTVLSRQVDGTGAEDRPFLSVRHQNNPKKKNILLAPFKTFLIQHHFVMEEKKKEKKTK